jgi:hypothetical protein
MDAGSGMRAARELAAAAGAREERAAQGAGEDARLAAHVEGTALAVIEDGHDTRIAQEPARRLRGNAGGPLNPSEGGGIDVDQDLDRRAIRLVAAQGRLGHRDQRVGALRFRAGEDIAGREHARGLVGPELRLHAHHAIGQIPRP